jgi:hypothetical protein
VKYLFIPYDPADSEVFEADTQRDMKRKWLELARQSTAKCYLFRFDENEPRGLRLVFSASDGEYSDFAGCLVGRLSFT